MFAPDAALYASMIAKLQRRNFLIIHDSLLPDEVKAFKVKHPHSRYSTNKECLRVSINKNCDLIISLQNSDGTPISKALQGIVMQQKTEFQSSESGHLVIKTSSKELQANDLDELVNHVTTVYGKILI